MSIASIVTRGFIGGVSFIPTRGFTPGKAAPAIIGGHFLPANHKHKRTLSNVQVVYNKAKALPRAETKALRDAISEFVDPSLALQAVVPDIEKINQEALIQNEAAYEKFSQALAVLQQKLEAIEHQKTVLIAKQQEEDDELLLITIISCLIH